MTNNNDKRPLQARLYDILDKRGASGWTAKQMLARLMCQLAVDLGELSAQVIIDPTIHYTPNVWIDRAASQSKNHLERSGFNQVALNDSDAVMDALAIMVGTALIMAEEISIMTGKPFDVLHEAAAWALLEDKKQEAAQAISK